MGHIIVIRNRTTKVTSQVDADLWHQNKNTPMWRGVFEYVKTIKEPPEVAELKALQAKAIKGKGKRGGAKKKAAAKK